MPGAPTLKELSRRWIEHSEVAKVLRAEWDLEPHNVFRLVSRGDTPPHSLTPTELLLRDILFGSLNVDSLDRLIRDARGARVPYGLVEVESLIVPEDRGPGKQGDTGAGGRRGGHIAVIRLLPLPGVLQRLRSPRPASPYRDVPQGRPGRHRDLLT